MYGLFSSNAVLHLPAIFPFLVGNDSHQGTESIPVFQSTLTPVMMNFII